MRLNEELQRKELNLEGEIKLKREVEIEEKVVTMKLGGGCGVKGDSGPGDRDRCIGRGDVGRKFEGVVEREEIKLEESLSSRKNWCRKWMDKARGSKGGGEVRGRG